MSRFYMGNFFRVTRTALYGPVKSSRHCTAETCDRRGRAAFAVGNGEPRCTALHLVLVYESSCEFGQIPNVTFMSQKIVESFLIMKS